MSGSRERKGRRAFVKAALKIPQRLDLDLRVLLDLKFTFIAKEASL
jgi:hypothetical protein